MSVPFKQSPLQGVDLDSDELRIAANKAQFIKGLTTNVSKNASAPAGQGYNFGAWHPLESNKAIAAVVLPAGNNHTIGFYQCVETNEGYEFVYNSLGSHLIVRINGNDASEQIVYQGSLLNFQYNPINFISEGRCVLKTQKYFDKVSGTNKLRKYLIFTDNFNPQRFISVDDSIATTSFSSSYFAGTFYDKSILINLGVPTPLDCIGITPVTPVVDETKQNQMVYIGWQFRLKFIDIYGRESEHGIISNTYITIIGGGCISNSNQMSRCVDLFFDAGTPLTNLIQIEYRKISNNEQNLSVPTDWFLYETIDKYDDSGNVPWYQRSINPNISFNSGNNKITYRFCADKLNDAITVDETNRLQNPLPQKSASIFPINKSIGLANNESGFEPFSETLMEKIAVSVVNPSGTSCGAAPLRTIIIYAYLHNPFNPGLDSKTWIFKNANDKTVFGDYEDISGATEKMDQVFPADQNGFVGYLAGTGYFAISEQVAHNAFTLQDIGFGVPLEADLKSGAVSVLGKGILLQRFTFHVPAGKYIFRIAGHQSTPTGNYQATSTYVLNRLNIGDAATQSGWTNDKEIVINCCAGDVILGGNTDKCFTICDFTNINPFSPFLVGCGLMDGYLKEDQTSKIAVEMQPVWFRGINIGITENRQECDVFGSFTTDHNGFWFCGTFANSATSTPAVEAKIITYVCGGTPPPTLEFSWRSPFIKHQGNVYFYSNGNIYPDNARRYVKGQITLCGNTSVGIAGVLVLLTKSQFAYTDTNGKYAIIVHNRINYVTIYIDMAFPYEFPAGYLLLPDYQSSPANTDLVIISQRGTCQITDCPNTCAYCFADYTLVYSGCGTVTNIALVTASMSAVNQKGLQSGGKYIWGIAGSDWMGRQNFVQIRNDGNQYLDIPGLIINQKFALSSLSFVINNTAVFPSWVKYLTFYITKNLNFDDFLYWAVDEVQFVDVTGQTNTINPTQIRLYYNSLNEYNKQFNFSTNTSWQFTTAPDGIQKSVVGDVVEFIMNGDGVWYNKKISSLVQYDKSGMFITIDYNGDLIGLKKGALVKLVRPTGFQTENIYYEQCFVIKVNNGVAATLTGDLNYFDSYILSRQLPVPIPKIDSNNEWVLTNTGNANDPNTLFGTPNDNNNGVIVMKQIDEATSYPFFFEHSSPSDQWGDHCANRGRINTINPSERKKIIRTEVTISAAINDIGDFNGLSYFDLGKPFVVVFDELQWGGIVCVIVETNVILFICENDNFLVSYNQSQLQVGGDGKIVVNTPYGNFSPPERKSGDHFGCLEFDINSIRKHKGQVLWVDRRRATLVVHNFSQVDQAEETGFKSYLYSKIAYQNTFNVGADKIIFVAGIDPKNDEYLLTSFLIPGPESSRPYVYLNNESEVNLIVNETLVIDLFSKSLKAFAPFTPEYYGTMEGWIHQKTMLTFRSAIAWSHHNGAVSLGIFNNFYGTQTKKYLKLIVNPYAEKVKKFLWIEVYCKEHKFVIPRIATEKGQASRLVASQWDFREKFWCAALLCDLNTPVDPNLGPQTGANVLLDGNPLSGRWMALNLASENTDDSLYCELSAVITYVNGVEKTAD